MASDKRDSEQTIIRDRLALDRTKMANERTLLAYLRTAVVLVLTGVTVTKLFPEELLMIVIACIVLVVGLGAGLVGVLHYLKTARRMERWRRQLDGATSPEASPDDHS